MKCGFKTNKILTAVAETDHTVTTSEGRVIHLKMASRPLKFQTSRKPEEPRKATNRCHRCGKFSSGELCETHLRIRAHTTEGTTCPHTLSKKCPRRVREINQIGTS